MGEGGSLHTQVNMQQFKQPAPATVEVTAAPADAESIFVEQPFDLNLTIKNRGAAPLVRCCVLLPCNTEASIIPLGLTEIPVPTLASGASVTLTVQMLPIEQGLREISGITVHDDSTSASYQVGTLLHSSMLTR
jgi:hypothetical protein